MHTRKIREEHAKHLTGKSHAERIAYYREQANKMDKVISVKALENYLLKIVFADGLRKVIDIRPFIGKGISAALKDEAYFRAVALEDGGGIAWPNGYDFCPNFLRDDVPALNVARA